MVRQLVAGLMVISMSNGVRQDTFEMGTLASDTQTPVTEENGKDGATVKITGKTFDDDWKYCEFRKQEEVDKVVGQTCQLTKDCEDACRTQEDCEEDVAERWVCHTNCEGFQNYPSPDIPMSALTFVSAKPPKEVPKPVDAPDDDALDACAAVVAVHVIQSPFPFSKEKECAKTGAMDDETAGTWAETGAKKWDKATAECEALSKYAKAATDYQSSEFKEFTMSFGTKVRSQACAKFDPDEMCKCVHEKQSHYLKCDSTKDHDSMPFDARCTSAGGELARFTLQKPAAPDDAVCAQFIAEQSKHMLLKRGGLEAVCKNGAMGKDLINFAYKYATQRYWPDEEAKNSRNTYGPLVMAHYKTKSGVSADKSGAVVTDEDRDTKTVKFLEDNVEQTIPEMFVIDSVPQVCTGFAATSPDVGKCFGSEWQGDGCAQMKERLTKVMTTISATMCK